MTCRAKFEIEDSQIEAMDLTLSITLRVSDWRQINNDLKDANDYTATQVRRAIDNAMEKVNAVSGQMFEVEP